MKQAVNFQFMNETARAKLWNEAQWDHMKSWGIDGVRWGFKTYCYHNRIEEFDKALAWCTERGMALSLRYRATPKKRPPLPPDVPAWLDMWKTLAERYKGEDHDKLFFSLYCEPNRTTIAKWHDAYQKGVDAVHSVDSDRICIVDDLNGGEAGEWGNLKAALKAPLSGEKIWYSTHVYRRAEAGIGMGWQNYGTTKEDCRAWLREHCKLDEALDRGFTVIIEETGLRAQEDQAWWLNFLTVLLEKGVGFAAWAWDPPGWGKWTLIKDLKGTPSWVGQVFRDAIGAAPSGQPPYLHQMCKPRNIWVSGQPLDWPWVIKAGFSWVINLRAESADPPIPELTQERVELASRTCPTYEQMTYLSRRMRELSPNDGSVKGLVHCLTTGRSSVVWAGYFIDADMTVDQAIATVEARMAGDEKWYSCARPFLEAYAAGVPPPPPHETWTDAEGEYFLKLDPGTYTVTFTKEKYEPGSSEAEVKAGEITSCDMRLQALPGPSGVDGVVVNDQTGEPIEKVKVEATKK